MANLSSSQEAEDEADAEGGVSGDGLGAPPGDWEEPLEAGGADGGAEAED